GRGSRSDGPARGAPRARPVCRSPRGRRPRKECGDRSTRAAKWLEWGAATPRPRRAIVEPDLPLRDQPLDLASALSFEQAGQVLVQSRGVDGDGVPIRLGQTGLERPLRQIVPSRSTATPMLIAESATLKIGQCGTWMKSMTEPLTPR